MKDFEDASRIKIEKSMCNNCGDCTFACPWHIFQSKDKKSIPQINNQGLCVSCGHCIAVCPTNAIIHINPFNIDKKNVDFEKIPAYDQTLELIRSRRSIRYFIDKHVEKDLIEKIINCACYAPSTNNVQSTDFTIIENCSVIKKISEITASYISKIIKIYDNPFSKNIIRMISKEKSLRINRIINDYKTIIKARDGNIDLILNNAPCLLFFNADKRIGFSDVNASLALQNATLAVHSLGMGSFYAGYVVFVCKQSKEIQNLINLPKTHQVYGCLGIGYPKIKYEHWIERKKPKIQWIN